MLTREISLASMLLHGDWSEDEDENPRKFETIDGSDIEFLELKISDKHERHTHDRILTKSLSQSLEELLHLTQNLVMRRKPKYWPTILFTLCVMRMITRDLGWRVLSRVYQALHDAHWDLCGLFEVTSKSFHPLSNKWDKEAYSRLVGGNDVLVGTFQWMHDWWLEGTYIPPMKCL